jgi:hypothetical protein
MEMIGEPSFKRHFSRNESIKRSVGGNISWFIAQLHIFSAQNFRPFWTIFDNDNLRRDGEQTITL